MKSTRGVNENHEVIVIDPTSDQLTPRDQAALAALLVRHSEPGVLSRTTLRDDPDNCQLLDLGDSSPPPGNLTLLKTLMLSTNAAYIICRDGLYYADVKKNELTLIPLNPDQWERWWTLLDENEFMPFPISSPTPEVLKAIRALTNYQPKPPGHDVTFTNPETGKMETVTIQLTHNILQREGRSIKKEQAGMKEKPAENITAKIFKGFRKKNENKPKLVLEVISNLEALGAGGTGLVRASEGTLTINSDGQGVKFTSYPKNSEERRRAIKITKPGMMARKVHDTNDADLEAFYANAAFYEENALLEAEKMSDMGVTLKSKPAVIAKGKVYTTMKQLPGKNLSEFISDNKTLALQNRLAMNISIVNAVKTQVHDAKMVHLDLKPGNIMMDVQGEKISTTIIDPDFAQPEGSIISSFRGTPAYVSREMRDSLFKSFKVDARTDIYSLGLILAEAVNPELARKFGRQTKVDLSDLFEPYKAARIPLKDQKAYIALVSEMTDPDIEKRPARTDLIAQRLQETTGRIMSHLASISPDLQQPYALQARSRFTREALNKQFEKRLPDVPNITASNNQPAETNVKNEVPTEPLSDVSIEPKASDLQLIDPANITPGSKEETILIALLNQRGEREDFGYAQDTPYEVAIPLSNKKKEIVRVQLQHGINFSHDLGRGTYYHILSRSKPKDGELAVEKMFIQKPFGLQEVTDPDAIVASIPLPGWLQQPTLATHSNEQDTANLATLTIDPSAELGLREKAALLALLQGPNTGVFLKYNNKNPDRSYVVDFTHPETGLTEKVKIKLSLSILKREGRSSKVRDDPASTTQEPKFVYELLDLDKLATGSVSKIKRLTGRLRLQEAKSGMGPEISYQAYGQGKGEKNKSRLVKITQLHKLAIAQQGINREAQMAIVKNEADTLAVMPQAKSKPLVFSDDHAKAYLVMEEKSGKDLYYLLKDNNSSTIPLVTRLTMNASIIETVASFHTSGRIHADLHPGNIIIDMATPLPTVHLIDVASSGEKGELRINGGGNYKYTAPELAAADSKTPVTLDESLDIYSLAKNLAMVINPKIIFGNEAVIDFSMLFSPYQNAGIPLEFQANLIQLLGEMTNQDQTKRPKLIEVQHRYTLIANQLSIYLKDVKLDVQTPDYRKANQPADFGQDANAAHHAIVSNMKKREKVAKLNLNKGVFSAMATLEGDYGKLRKHTLWLSKHRKVVKLLNERAAGFVRNLDLLLKKPRKHQDAITLPETSLHIKTPTEKQKKRADAIDLLESLVKAQMSVKQQKAYPQSLAEFISMLNAKPNSHHYSRLLVMHLYHAYSLKGNVGTLSHHEIEKMTLLQQCQLPSHSVYKERSKAMKINLPPSLGKTKQSSPTTLSLASLAIMQNSAIYSPPMRDQIRQYKDYLSQIGKVAIEFKNSTDPIQMARLQSDGNQLILKIEKLYRDISGQLNTKCVDIEAKMAGRSEVQLSQLKEELSQMTLLHEDLHVKYRGIFSSGSKDTKTMKI